jgi:hypothetical protein
MNDRTKTFKKTETERQLETIMSYRKGLVRTFLDSTEPG